MLGQRLWRWPNIRPALGQYKITCEGNTKCDYKHRTSKKSATTRRLPRANIDSAFHNLRLIASRGIGDKVIENQADFNRLDTINPLPAKHDSTLFNP